MVKKFLKLLFFLLCLTIFSTSIYARDLSKKEINLYVKKINRLKSQKKLTKYVLPHKSQLGALSGYYLDGKLVYMEAVHGGDQLENRYYIYLKDNKTYKAIVEHFRYPNEYVQTGKNYRLIAAEKPEIFYPRDLIKHYLSEAISSGIKNLDEEKELVKQ